MTPAEQLAKWVAGKYQGQLIKKTSTQYYTHLIAVAEMADPVALWGYEIGLCHDLLEDTNTTAENLKAALLKFGYDLDEATYITARVVELTDVFTRAAYPGLAKASRKKMEAERLCNISAGAQTVKYCDLVDNIKWVLQYDKKHAVEYLKKKGLLALAMTAGDEGTRLKLLELINAELLVLNR